MTGSLFPLVDIGAIKSQMCHSKSKMCSTCIPVLAQIGDELWIDTFLCSMSADKLCYFMELILHFEVINF